MSGALDSVLKKVGHQAASGGPNARGRTPAAVVPEYVTFPTEYLPPVLREMVEEVAEAVGCDPCHAALPGLSLVGAAIGPGLVASPKRKYVEPPIIWTCDLSDSGTGKTPAAAPFRELAARIEAELIADHAAVMADHAEKVTARKAAGAEGAKPTAPIRESFLISDTTYERLCEDMQSSPRGLLIHVEELAGFFDMLGGRYSKGSSDRPRWLPLFDGGPLIYRRRGGTNGVREVYSPYALATVMGGVQPAILRRILWADSGHAASGLLGRLVFAAPPKTCPRWTEKELSTDTEAAMYRVLKYLRSLPYDARQGPTRVRLDTNAHALFVAFSDSCMERAEDAAGPMAAMWPKLARIGLRLALLHFAVSEAAAGRDAGRSCINKESMAAGIALAEWFGREAGRVYQWMTMTDDDADLAHLLAWVRQKDGRVVARDLQRSNAAKFPTSDAARLALDGLVVAGLAEWQTVKPTGGGWAAEWLVLLDSPAEHTTNDT